MFGSKHRAEVAQAEAWIAELRSFIEPRLDDDGSMSEDGFNEVDNWKENHPECPQCPETNDAHDALLRQIQIGCAQNGLATPLGRTTLILKRDEFSFADEDADLLKEVTLREFKGGSKGISIPLGQKGYARGVRLSTRGYRGHMETIGKEWQTADTGSLTVTNQRIVFHGSRKTLEFPFGKLATLNAYSDGIELGVTSRQATSKFRGLDGEFLAEMIRALFVALDKQRDDG